MNKVAYLECPTGLAGDMCLGALVHAGVPLDYLIQKLQLLGIADEYHLWAELVHRNGQQATKVHVDLARATSPEEMVMAAERAESNDRHDATTATGLYHYDHEHYDHEHYDHEHEPYHGSHAHHHTVASTATIANSDTEAHSHATEASPLVVPHTPELVRHLPEIERLITAAGLPLRAETWSLAVFRQLAVAEGAVHGVAPDQVHFHEVGATDAIVDIVGTCLGLDWLGIEKLYCSPLPSGGGTIWAAHGRLPVPTPAVLKLWEMRQVPVYSNGIERELVTPTGAAIATTLATQFSPPPAMTLHKVGLGAGSRDLPIPNILRLWIGEETEKERRVGNALQHPVHQRKTKNQINSNFQSLGQEAIALLETQIDDLNPQAIGYVFEALFAAGAVDVFTQAIGMKKSRPGILLTVVCHPESTAACEAILFRETSTLGIRHSQQQRTILNREIQQIQTDYGTVRVKIAWRGNGPILNVQPEYEDCARLAQQHQLPWREVHRATLQTWYAQHQTRSKPVTS